jgi:hypothetical protein
VGIRLGTGSLLECPPRIKAGSDDRFCQPIQTPLKTNNLERRMTMTENPSDHVQVLARAMMDATENHGVLHDELMEHVHEVADTVITAILANTEQGAKLRAALGVKVSETTRMGKNLRAAMDAYDDN